MMSLFYGHLKIAQFLVDKGANINLKDVNGLTALHYAVDSNILASVEFILMRISDVNVQDNQGWTPVLRAGK